MILDRSGQKSASGKSNVHATFWKRRTLRVHSCAGEALEAEPVSLSLASAIQEVVAARYIYGLSIVRTCHLRSKAITLPIFPNIYRAFLGTAGTQSVPGLCF